MTFAENVIHFYETLQIKTKLPKGVEVLNPFGNSDARLIFQTFYKKFYNDYNRRTLILGINPGRFGGGITGVPFTDPIKLEHYCGIKNDLQKKAELSADFIYKMITAYGGTDKFYNKFYISAISPLGFTKDGKNLNYYDIKELTVAIDSFILESITKQLSFGINRKICFCLGEGDNFKFLSKLNDKHKFFEQIEPLAHPRFIMQYKRKKLDEYIINYITKLSSSP